MFCMCSVCLYHMHDRFGARTEALMHQLYDSSAEALAATSSIQSALTGVDDRLVGMGGQLEAVHSQQQELGTLATDTLQQSVQIRGEVSGIQDGLRSVKAAGVSCFPTLVCLPTT